MTINNKFKVKEITEASASVGLLLATAVAPVLPQPCGQTLQRLLTHQHDPSFISAVI